MGPSSEIRISQAFTQPLRANQNSAATPSDPTDQLVPGRGVERSPKETVRHSLAIVGRLAQYSHLLGSGAALGVPGIMPFMMHDLRVNHQSGVFEMSAPTITFVGKTSIYSLPGNVEVVDRTHKSLLEGRPERRTLEGHQIRGQERIPLEVRPGPFERTIEVVNPDGTITVLDQNDLSLSYKPNS